MRFTMEYQMLFAEDFRISPQEVPNDPEHTRNCTLELESHEGLSDGQYAELVQLFGEDACLKKSGNISNCYLDGVIIDKDGDFIVLSSDASEEVMMIYTKECLELNFAEKRDDDETVNTFTIRTQKGYEDNLIHIDLIRFPYSQSGIHKIEFIPGSHALVTEFRDM